MSTIRCSKWNNLEHAEAQPFVDILESEGLNLDFILNTHHRAFLCSPFLPECMFRVSLLLRWVVLK